MLILILCFSSEGHTFFRKNLTILSSELTWFLRNVHGTSIYSNVCIESMFFKSKGLL